MDTRLIVFTQLSDIDLSPLGLYIAEYITQIAPVEMYWIVFQGHPILCCDLTIEKQNTLSATLFI